MLVRTMHDIDPDQTIYRADPGEGAEIARALRHSSCGISPGGELAFSSNESEWAAFYADPFCSVIAPALVEIYSAASAGQFERVIDADARLVDALPSGAADRLKKEASEVFAAREGAKSMRALDRLAAAEHGASFTGAFAVHSAAFNVPLLHTLIAYLAVEWKAGVAQPVRPEDWERAFTAEVLDLKEPIAAVLSRCLRDRAFVA